MKKEIANELNKLKFYVSNQKLEEVLNVLSYKFFKFQEFVDLIENQEKESSFEFHLIKFLNQQIVIFCF